MRACKCDGMRAGDVLISQTCMQGGFRVEYRTRCDRGNEDVAMLEVGIVSRCQINGARSYWPWWPFAAAYVSCSQKSYSLMAINLIILGPCLPSTAPGSSP